MSVTVTIEVPRGGFVKRGATGEVEFRSPVPCPFNYGSVDGDVAEDGDPFDAIVLGPTLALGARVQVDVHGVVRFIDAGRVDDKLVCGTPPSRLDVLRIRAFFTIYAEAKRLRNRARHRNTGTEFKGYERL